MPKGFLKCMKQVRALSIKGLQPDKDNEGDGKDTSVLVRPWGSTA